MPFLLFLFVDFSFRISKVFNYAILKSTIVSIAINVYLFYNFI
jgi:hypothetical protein